MAFSTYAVKSFDVSKNGGGAAVVMGTTYLDGLVMAFRFENNSQFLHGFLRWDFAL